MIRPVNKLFKTFCLSLIYILVNAYNIHGQEGTPLNSFVDLEIYNSRQEVVEWDAILQPEEIYSLRFTLTSKSIGDDEAYLFTGGVSQVVMKIGDQEIKGGKYMPSHERTQPKEFYFLPLPKLDSNSTEVQILVQNSVGFSGSRPLLEGDVLIPDFKKLKIFSGREYQVKRDSILEQDKFYVTVIHVFIGAIGFTTLFVFLLFLLNRELAFFYYSAYLFCFFLFGVFHSRVYNDVGLWLSQNPVVHQNLPEVLIWVGMFFHGYYTIHLLELHKDVYPKLNRYILFISWFSLLAAFSMCVALLWSNNFGWYQKCLEWMRFSYSPLGLIAILWLLISAKSSLKYLLAIGVGIWAVLGNYSSTFAVSDGIQLTAIGLGSNNAIIWTCLGLLLESVMFSFALGVKMKIGEEERVQNKQALIEKMGELQELQNQQNIALEEKVNEKSKELLRAYELVEKQKQKELEESYQKRIAQSEMEALRSQMNPHFIFNSLSSIKHLVLSGDSNSASTYLSRFAKLLRQILTFSRKESITLEQELSNIKLYLELESKRFDDRFSFSIEPDLQDLGILEMVRVPSLLLQPFVENSILHGLMQSEKATKTILISVKKENDQLKVIIEDNGIGRKAAERFKNEHNQSLGTKITEERVALFNETFNTNIRVEIQDLSTGTRVCIWV